MDILKYILIILSPILLLIIATVINRRKRKKSIVGPKYIELEENIKQGILSKQSEDCKGVVILCESEPCLQNKYSDVIESIGYECKMFRTADRVLLELCESKCNLLITDLMLSGNYDGLQLINTLNKGLKLNIPIIILTNITLENVIRESFKAGICNYLVKTDISDEDLIKEVKKYFIN